MCLGDMWQQCGIAPHPLSHEHTSGLLLLKASLVTMKAVRVRQAGRGGGGGRCGGVRRLLGRGR